MTRRSDRRASVVTTPVAPDGGRSLLGFRIPLVSLMQALAVAEHLNFRRAAVDLGVTQSSVSERVKRLEQDLGVTLFERRHRGVRLTDVGRRFLEQVAAAVDQLDHAIKTAGAMACGDRGRLRIGVLSSLGSGFLADLLDLYVRRHPHVDLQVIEGRSRDTIALVREGQLDVAFVVGVPNAEDCRVRPLWAEALFVALPAGHRLSPTGGITWSDLAEEVFLVRHGGSGPQVHDHIVRRLSARGLGPKICREDVGRDTLMSMVAQGRGVTLSGEAATSTVFPGVVFRRIVDEPEPVTFSAVWSPGNRSRMLRNLLDLAGPSNGSKPSR